MRLLSLLMLKTPAPECRVCFEGLAIGPLCAVSVDFALRDVVATKRVEVKALRVTHGMPS